MSQELAVLESSVADAWKPPVKGSHGNRAAKIKVGECAQLVVEDEKFEDTIPIYAEVVISDNHKDSIDPQSYKAPNESSLTDNWDTEMNETLDAIGWHQVLGDFVRFPEGRNALPSHWVYKIKRDGAGNLQWFKARLVCGKNHQFKGINNQPTYELTAFLSHVTLAVVIAAKYNLEIHQLDVCTAFLGVDFEEEIRIHPPQRYSRLLQKGMRYNNLGSKTPQKMVLCLRKSCYCLKQSSHIGYSTCLDFVSSIEFAVLFFDGRTVCGLQQESRLSHCGSGSVCR
jgi:hypothetical protein